MFIDDKKLIDIKILYKKSGRNQYDAYSEDEFKKLDIDNKEKFKELNVKMLPLTWGLYNDLQDAAMMSDSFGNRRFSYKIYKETRLRRLMVQWDAQVKNNQGQLEPVPINDNSIRRLAPEIGETILAAYDAISVMDGDDENF